MKLKSKILVILAVFSFGVYAAGCGIISIAFTGFIRQQEQNQTAKDVNGLWQYMLAESQDQLSIAEDWADRDDTYRFLDNGNFEFVQKNFHEQTMQDIGLHFMFLYDNGKQIKYSVYYDSQANKLTNFPKDILASVNDFIVSSGVVTGTQSYYLCSSTGIFCVTVSPVTDSLRTAPADGILVTGKRLDSDSIAKMDEITGGEVSVGALYDLNGSLLQRIEKQPAQAGGPQTISVPISASRMETYIVPPVAGIGSPLVAVMAKQRDIYLEGQGQLLFALSLFLALIAAVLLMLLWCLNRNVTKPFSRLMKSVAGIQLSGERIDRLPVKGSGEIAELSGTVNAMIDKIEQGYDNRLQLFVSRYPHEAGARRFQRGDEAGRQYRGIQTGLRERELRKHDRSGAPGVHAGDPYAAGRAQAG